MSESESSHNFASWRTTVIELGLSPILVAIDLSQRYNNGSESYALTLAGGAMFVHAFLNICMRVDQAIDVEVDEKPPIIVNPQFRTELPSSTFNVDLPQEISAYSLMRRIS